MQNLLSLPHGDGCQLSSDTRSQQLCYTPHSKGPAGAGGGLVRSHSDQGTGVGVEAPMTITEREKSPLGQKNASLELRHPERVLRHLLPWDVAESKDSGTF